MGRPTNISKIIKLLEVDHELVNHKNEYTDFGLCWIHKVTGEYFTPDGLELESKFLLTHTIDKPIAHGLGFSTKQQKWFGWSHRAIYGFGIGSKVERGNCAFVAGTQQEAISCINDFWMDEHLLWTKSEIKFNENDQEQMIYTSWKYNDTVPNRSLRQTIGSVWTPIPKLGKGEWTARTLDDAKQMAIDFQKSVS